MNVINKDTVRAENEKALMGKKINLVDFCAPGVSKSKNIDQAFTGMGRMAALPKIGNMSSITYSGKYGTGFDVPFKWSDGKMASTRERIESGAFMSGNTLPTDWQNLWDALRIDVSVRKEATPTIRQLFYNINENANYDKTVNISEISPFGVAFEENNGHGQAVAQGETLGGAYDSITMVLYAAGFTWDLMASLFDRTITPERLMDAVMVGYNAKLDDIAMSPILDYSYSGAQQTAANTTSGAGRQELLYLTYQDALEDLAARLHPVTNRRLSVSNCLLLNHPTDALHSSWVTSGLPSVNERRYPALTQIRGIVEYDGESIPLRDRTITYSGVTEGTAYLAIPAGVSNNNYMKIAVKKGLTVEVDAQPDVKTLTQEERAYWFCEAIFYEGREYFIQEVTLPTW